MCAPPSTRARGRLATVLFLVACGTPQVAAAKVLPRATAEERRGFLALRSRMGYVWFQDDNVLFTKPYNRQTLERLVAKTCDPRGSLPGRVGFFGLLTQVIQFSEVPATDLKAVARPAVVRAIEDLGKRAKTDPGVERLVQKARRCLWNLDYALATAELQKLRAEGKDLSNAPAMAKIERLQKEAIERAKSKRRRYLGDLVTWHMRADLDTAAHKISQLAKLERSNWRVLVARDKLRVRRKLKKCENDDQRVAVLIQAAEDPGNSIPLQGWAVRTLSHYPTEAAIKFLYRLHNTAREKRRTDLGLEAQEALRRLKKIPQSEHRYRVM